MTITRNKVFDTFQPSNLLTEVDKFVEDGYSAAGVYYFRSSGFKERMTWQLAAELSKHLWLVSVWENGRPTSPAYFSSIMGFHDGSEAMGEAKIIRQPLRTPIYFAVDYDASIDDLPAIRDYFLSVNKMLKGQYHVGAYGSGLVLGYLRDEGLINYTWLSQSHGFAGYDNLLKSGGVNIIQGPEHTVFGLDVDEDTTAGNGGGWKVL